MSFVITVRKVRERRPEAVDRWRRGPATTFTRRRVRRPRRSWSPSSSSSSFLVPASVRTRPSVLQKYMRSTINSSHRPESKYRWPSAKTARMRGGGWPGHDCDHSGARLLLQVVLWCSEKVLKQCATFSSLHSDARSCPPGAVILICPIGQIKIFTGSSG